MNEASIDLIAAEILRYLRRNPRAKDTVEGIVRWWLPPLHDRASTEATERALNGLVEQGQVLRVASPTGGVLYSLAVHDRAGTIASDDEAAAGHERDDAAAAVRGGGLPPGKSQA
ncbi:MAG: hypothetical protein JW940_19975 [Polyangiaceae bacterium]|nr:hypothetical protein [Polyangiaceae bacterium]